MQTVNRPLYDVWDVTCSNTAKFVEYVPETSIRFTAHRPGWHPGKPQQPNRVRLRPPRRLR